jgi:hypothetical protein
VEQLADSISFYQKAILVDEQHLDEALQQWLKTIQIL